MKQRNQTFIAFGKKFNALGRRWAAWMSKKETGISLKRKKIYLGWFVIVMVLLLWVPLFFKNNNSVINVGSIKPPIELNRNDYASQTKKLNYLIDSVRKDSIRLDSIKKNLLKKDSLKNR
jgi:hypothetical protein